MKKREMMIVAILLIIGWNMLASHIDAKENRSKLDFMANAMESHDISINDWSLYSKKTVDKKSIEEVKHFTKQYRQYTWTYETEDDVYKAIGVYHNNDKDLTEKLQFITTLTNDHTQSYILYEVKGVSAQNDWNNLTDTFNKQAFDIFREETTTFACLTGSIDDMMKGVLNQKSNELLKYFHAETIEELQEDQFVSVSAKTPLWEDFIPTTDDNMNMQISLRSDGLGAKTTVVIGTPIITSEY
ncbi:hypothetical protein FS935_19020 [Metabacillus litoralis]|uniref:YwmB family TATA-box binding protein n=1 Tax=Metabacillus litoralis TaxID=152268 RepID=A0A5C6VK27_9BACI|nr:YwmB family TATA-box binding protein [Metabacillus litoralis]TXC85922.1 hypothetical protein FS935_19020 [Metabacillus litoralis]